MKLSKSTLAVLKNMASINLNLYIKDGNKLSTKSPANTIIADIEVEENFETPFGIYDLGRFLGVLGLHDDPDLEFDDKKVTVKEGKYSTVYYGAEPEILTYPEKSIKFPDSDIDFNVASSDIEKALKAANVLGCSTFTFEGDSEKIYLVVSDPAVEGSNSFKLEIGDTDKEFKANIKIENIKFLQMDYEVSLSKKKIARFSSDEGKIIYYIALDSTSTFD